MKRNPILTGGLIGGIVGIILVAIQWINISIECGRMTGWSRPGFLICPSELVNIGGFNCTPILSVCSFFDFIIFLMVLAVLFIISAIPGLILGVFFKQLSKTKVS